MSHIAVDSMAVRNWHRLDVCSWEALARTQVSVIGALDQDAVEEIDVAVMTAQQHQFSVHLNLDQVSSVTPQAMDELVTRGWRSQVLLAG
jgi:hypothetical protein